MQPVSGWQGIRDSDTSGQYLITGTSDANGLLYEGPIAGVGGTSYSVNYPNAATTSVYGPDNLGGTATCGWSGVTRTATAPSMAFSSRARPPTSRRAATTGRSTIPTRQYTYVHSTMGDLAVGNADGPEGNAPLGTGHAFLYDVAQNTFLTDIVYPGSTTTTAYGIWYNGGTSYTICGGYSPTVARRSESADRPWLPGRLRLRDRAIHPLDVVRLPERAGRTGLRHPFRGHQQRREGCLHAQCRLGPDRFEQSRLRARWVTVRRNTDGSFGAGGLGQPELSRLIQHGIAQRQFGGRQSGGRDRASAARASSRTRRRSTSASSSPTSSAATAATASESTGPTTTRSP